MKYIFFFGFLLLLFSCNLEGVKRNNQSVNVTEDDSVSASVDNQVNSITDKKSETHEEKASDTLRLENGIIITYFKKGTGKKLEKGDVVNIDYRAKLTKGKIFDGNHLIKKPAIPFLVGWNQQTPGWDMAMKYLRVGDDVDIFLPAKYDRGEQGIKDIVPPNSNTILSLRILDEFQPTFTDDGIKIWRYDEYKEQGEIIKEGDEVFINYFVSSESNPRYDNNYRRGELFNLIVGNVSILPGLNRALLHAREGDRMFVLIPAEYGYGEKGFQDLVKPNESIFYDVQIAKVNRGK